MESTYAFDPYDWTTIIPLFMALNEAPVSDDGFATWLAHWNELDIAVYDAWTHLKRRSYIDTTNRTAEHAYQVFPREIFSTYLGLTNMLTTRALTLQPDPPSPSQRELWRRWQNQTTLFHPDSLVLQAEISEWESGYRELTRRIEQLGGDQRAHWMERRTEINELMLRLLRLRRELARTSNLPTFLAYRWRELNRLDFSIAACQTFHQAVEHVVVPVVTQLRAKGARKPSLPDIRELAVLSDGIERILTHVDVTFGDVFHAMRPDYLDVGSRPGKADTSEQWFFPRAGLPYLHVTSNNPATLLHESGHAVHAYFSFQTQGSLWNFCGPDEFQEFVATAMELLCWPYYEHAQGGLYSPAESAAVRQRDLLFYLEALASTVREDAFEHWIYGEAPESLTPADIDTMWLAFTQRFTPWEDPDAPEQEVMTGWQRGNWSLFRIPLYTIAYPIAIVGTCLLGRRVEQDRARVITDYKAALALGNTEPLPELFRVAGLVFPFTQQAVEEAVRFALDHYLTTKG